jgi:hypothetical protein
MAANEARWTLEDLIDFEQAASVDASVSQSTREAVLAVAHGREAAAARRAGLRVWLDACEEKSAGRKFSLGLSGVGAGLVCLLFLAGASAVLGLFDRQRGGIHVGLFLALLLGVQWLILLVTVSAWLLRRRATGVLGLLAKRISGQKDASWWGRLMDGDAAAKAAMLWRLARLTQAGGVFFNLGLISGLAGLVLVRHIGFYWETTTEATMRGVLEAVVNFLSLPWSAWWPEAVPSAAVIESSRYFPGQTATLAPGPTAWWEFLLMTLLVWGLLPRAILWVLAWFSEKRALAQLDFQARHHRALWRELTGQQRAASEEKPLDGVLVLDVGGSGFSESELRPFLLRRLRVNPTAWRSTAVLDAGAEDEAARSLARAPAGVVLLVEGWSLSIPRMAALHAKIRSSAGAETPVKFLVVQLEADHSLKPVSPDETREWTRFVDSLRDPAAEVFFYE